MSNTNELTIIEAIEYWIKDAKKLSEDLEDEYNRKNDPDVKLRIVKESNILIHLRVSYLLHKVLLNEIEKIYGVLEKLPKTEEFKEVKEEVKEIQEIANSTLVPIKKEREKLEELQKRGNDIYG